MLGEEVRVKKTEISDLFTIETCPISDKRGSLTRLFCEDVLSTVMDSRKVVHINKTVTKKVGAIRGLHFQYPPLAEMKFIQCSKGKVWDVVVDLRKNSPDFLSWHAEELTALDGRILVVPEGFAHGFQVLEPYSELLYFHTAPYNPLFQGGVRFDDGSLKISWPLEVTDISESDMSWESLGLNFEGVSL